MKTIALAHEGPDTRPLIDALNSMPDDGYGPWWSTSDGQWLHDIITTRIAETVVQSVKSTYGVDYEPADVANTAVTVLESPARRTSIVEADNPWAYLYATLRREMSKQAGEYFRIPIREGDPHFIASSVEPDDEGLSDAIVATVTLLVPLTPPQLREALIEAVFYFAERGHSREHSLYSFAWRDSELIEHGLSRDQTLAIANIVLGARPDRGATSVLGAFLADANWRPNSQVMAALHKYQIRMLRSLRPEVATTRRKAA